MKIIDLLNKIANGEEVPKEIRYRGCLFAFDNETQDYYCERYGNLFEYLINEEITSAFLNNKVEIVGVNKIKKIKDLNTDYYDKCKTYDCLQNEEIVLDILTLKHKINEIIDYINKESK